jgi:diadenosine tetraphosphate (Ap4A) HIT family hydrolase
MSLSLDQLCPFCPQNLRTNEIVLENDACYFLQGPQPVLAGSGLIIPKAHRETVFDLTEAEWSATFALLLEVKELLDRVCAPQGYNVGWNAGATGGQEVFHAHLHVIPRYADEPYAGKGIRYWLKQEANRRGVVTDRQ